MAKTLREFLTGTIDQRSAELARTKDADRLIRQYVLPTLPKTIDRFEVSNASGSGSINEQRVTSLHISYAPLQLTDQASHDVAFGTIPKVVAGLKAFGWSVVPEPDMRAGWNEGLTVMIMASLHIAERQTLMMPKQPARDITLSIAFNRMPETEHCRIEETEELVPAEMRKVRKVVCDEPPSWSGESVKEGVHA